MPTYDFQCDSCAYYEEIKQGFDGPSEHQCPFCGMFSLKKVFINPPSVMVRGEPTTIGQLADRNTAKMGTYEIQDKNASNNINQNKEINTQRQLRRKINSMTPEQKIRWIKDGD